MVPILECPVCGGVMIPGSIHRCPVTGPRPVDDAYLNSRYYRQLLHEVEAATAHPELEANPEPKR